VLPVFDLVEIADKELRARPLLERRRAPRDYGRAGSQLI